MITDPMFLAISVSALDDNYCVKTVKIYLDGTTDLKDKYKVKE